ncbi:nitroreductase [Pandoraea nosoerga]|uniref:Nitroreductase n=1 Tax=Pandoraea nosoerga TaxID=2508296 RepID=A0A5E4X7B7_9BURK|nr:nitroreductase [Pandoraea nosoerga]MBN4675188.1 nitroreductase [Pandoraea nosoerga]MBN4680839.1 nitroreductase [Pandoraea nosoerga]MBN4744841.1 nitroreductase [Pandoraea nosoerga]VVE32166.1 nitroreductase [Pandoraea nosoerga]
MKHSHPSAHAAQPLSEEQNPVEAASPGESPHLAAVNGNPDLRVEYVDEAIRSRRSIRAYLPTPVPQDTVAEILSVASRAPSGSNIQPWQTYVLTGDALHRLTSRLLDAFNDPAQRLMHQEEYAYYPREWTEPYQARRRKVGWDLYGLLGIGRADKDRMHGQHARNFRFFDAPVGMIFTIDRHLELGSWLDYGMFLQSVMVAARARGLDTCPQAAFATFHRIIAEQLHLPEARMVVCGMALGYADPDAVENRLVTERAPLQEWAHFLN